MFEGTVTATDMSRATDAREKDRIGIFGTGFSYAGSYGRVTSESIGRDLNPLGRGAGQALVGGMQQLGRILPSLIHSQAQHGIGNSINNDCIGGSCNSGQGAGSGVTAGLPNPNYDSGHYSDWINPLCPTKPCSYKWNILESQDCRGYTRPNPTYGLSISCCNQCVVDRRQCISDNEWISQTFDFHPEMGCSHAERHAKWQAADAEGIVNCCSDCRGKGSNGGPIDFNNIIDSPINQRNGNISQPMNQTDPEWGWRLWNLIGVSKRTNDSRLQEYIDRLKDCVCGSKDSRIPQWIIRCICASLSSNTYAVDERTRGWDAWNTPGSSLILVHPNVLAQSECRLMGILLHETAHTCGVFSPEWNDDLYPFYNAIRTMIIPIYRGIIIGPLFKPVPQPITHGVGINSADNIAYYLLQNCCCSTKQGSIGSQ